MAITGLPVTINIFHWLAENAAKNTQWFDKTQPTFQILQAFSSNQEFNLSSYDNDSQNIIYDYSRWLAILVLSFDGGLETSNVRSFAVTDEQIMITWSHDLTYKIDLNGWSRNTRRAVDYIFERACSVSQFSSDMSQSKLQIYNYLRFYREQLESIHHFSTSGVDQQFENLIGDSNFTFTILSAMPIDILQHFYAQLSHLFSDDLAIPGLSTPVSLKHFFSKSYINEITLLDKVKLHYNLQLFSQLDSTLIQAITAKTNEFIELSFKDPKVVEFVSKQIRQVSDLQLQPRLQLVELIERQFFQGFL